jgi:serine/threonine-protein kinase HipA
MNTPRASGSNAGLTVLLGGRVAGTVSRENRNSPYRFTYDDAWRNDTATYPLSLSIPLAGKTQEGQAVGWYLRGLLPDNQARLDAIAVKYDVDPEDILGLLASVGEDCPGAVQFARPDRLSSLLAHHAEKIDWLSNDEVADMLRGLESEGEGFDTGIDVGQFSLPGALPKVALARDRANQRWGRPHGRAASTHILKPPLRGVPFHNEIEHLCLELARHSGLRAASSRVINVEGQSAIAVERYDRVRKGATVVRLHQEDCSQALGANPRLKYSSERAPGIAEIVGLLRDQSSRGLDDVYDFLKGVAFNWVIAGTEAHPRNYSVLISSGSDVVLAPLYDLASALLLKTRTKVADLPFPMTVAGRKHIGAIDLGAWNDLAKELRLMPARLIAEVSGVASAVADTAPKVAEKGKLEGLNPNFCDRFATKLRGRALACLAALKV